MRVKTEMFCTKCGKEQQYSYKSCDDCGKPFEKAPAATISQRKPPVAVRSRSVENPQKTAVERALEASGNHGRVSHSRELGELPGLLGVGEKPIAIVTGHNGSRNTVAMATDHRVILVGRGVFSRNVERIAYEQISNFNYQTGMFNGSITLRTSSSETVIGNIPNTMVQHFAEAMGRVGK